MNKILLTDSEAAEAIGVGASTIWRWTKNGDFPQPIKLTGGCTRWRMVDVAAFIDEMAHQQQAQVA